jgi:phosphoribosylanthranilate isomerase
MSRTRIVIAGVKDAESARHAAEAGADGVGLVFVPGSPRFVEPDHGFEIVSTLPPLVAGVGIFRNSNVDNFADVEQVCPTALTLFAGEEDVETVCGCGPDLIKSVVWSPTLGARDLIRWASLDEVSALMIDARGSAASRTDGTIDWTSLAESLEPLVQAISKPVFLAGGLTKENVGTVVRTLCPYGVMVCAGVERETGVIDPRMVDSFCRSVINSGDSRS